MIFLHIRSFWYYIFWIKFIIFLYNNQEVVIGLADRGHDVEGDSSIAVVQLVTKEGNKIYATSDPRKSGHGADGY